MRKIPSTKKTTNINASTVKTESVGFGLRFLAIMIDGMILGLITSFWRGMFSFRLAQSIGYFVNAAYPILLWVNWNGQTIGKKLVRIKVVQKNGQPLDYRTAILRYIGYIVSTIPLFLGFFWVIWDSEKQGWHDKIAQTKVVRE